MPSQVADAVGNDLGGPEPVEEAHREEVGEQREGAAVVGVDDRVRAAAGVDLPQPVRDRPDGLVPRDGREVPGALGTDAPQRAGQRTAGSSHSLL